MPAFWRTRTGKLFMGGCGSQIGLLFTLGGLLVSLLFYSICVSVNVLSASGLVRLGDGQITCLPPPLSSGLDLPRWTQDGRLLVTAHAGQPDQGAVYIYDISGQGQAASGSYTQTEPAVSGRMVCRIERNSCAYERLVGLVDPTIVYKQEESPPFDEEDILMHPALIAPLTRLNRLVKIEWGTTVQLRVADAYDSQLDHDPPQTDPARAYSLHYEGRAIDLTLSPIDRRQYGRLCALAHCAGFDWALHEGTHCHASINAVSLCSQCGD